MKLYIRGVAVILAVLIVILNVSITIDRTINTAKKPNVVWFLIDALRADHLGCYGYPKKTSPFIDSFAKENILFTDAFSQESYTQASVPSYFTSTYPLEHNVLYDQPTIDILDTKFITLAEVLQNEHYVTAGFVFNPHLKAKFNFGQGFELYDDNEEGFIGRTVYEAFETAEKIFQKVDKYLKITSKRPTFLYLHYRDVHEPYAPPPPYHTLFLAPDVQPAVDILFTRQFPYSKRKDIHISQYDGEIRYIDSYIEKTMRLLEKYNITKENSIIIITADHGEEFADYHPGDPGGISHGRTLYMEQIHVPLIMSIPGIVPQARKFSSYVELVDLVPTILDILGIDSKKYNQFQGKSLLPLLKDFDTSPSPRSVSVYSGGNYGRGVIIEGEWKYYYYDKYMKEHYQESFRHPMKDYTSIFGEELYNIKYDPKETVNLIDTEKDIAWKLKQQLERIHRSISSEQSSPSIEIDEQTEEQLRSLGYIR